QSSDFVQAARQFRRQFHIVNAGSETEIDTAFRTLAERRVSALVVSSDPFFVNRRQQIIAHAAPDAIPAIYTSRGYVAGGRVMCTATSYLAAYPGAGSFFGRIPKGPKPAALPIWQATEFELVINSKTAKALGLTIPDKLIALADEVIE